jgi:adenosylcobinamide-phosphate synthase
MSLTMQILLAVLLDLLLGDPRRLPHPVRLIGRMIEILENPLRKFTPSQRFNGSLLAVMVIAAAGGVTCAALRLAAWIHPLAADAVSVLFLYTALSIRDLVKHSTEVYRGLKSGDLAAARSKVAWMVGRDTDVLDEKGVIRAAVESVAENTVDGVVAPLFFAALFGPVGTMMYKAVSTLDSMIGYRNEKYFHFGRAAARIDDAANFLPARITAPLMAIGALLTGNRPVQAWRICLRDRRHHASPNSGIPEAAMAGALGVQLGGPLLRKGVLTELPTMGDALTPLEKTHILKANAVMLASSLAAAAIFTAARWMVEK